MQPLDYASADRIKQIESLKDTVMDEVGVSDEQCDFNDLLYVCNAQFRDSPETGNLLYKAFIFTIHDIPNINDPNKHMQAAEYAKVG